MLLLLRRVKLAPGRCADHHEADHKMHVFTGGQAVGRPKLARPPACQARLATAMNVRQGFQSVANVQKLIQEWAERGAKTRYGS